MRLRLSCAAASAVLVLAACDGASPPADEWGDAAPDADADLAARAERERNFKPSRTPPIDFDLWATTDLPVVATAGVIPARDAVVLTIGTGGTGGTAPAVNGVAVTWDEARRHLTKLCDLARPSPGAPSEATLLIVADRVTPWREVARALRTAADQNVAASHVAFVVRIAEDGACGTFATFLPEDLGIACAPEDGAPIVRLSVGIRAAAAGDPLGSARPDMTSLSAACAAVLRPGGVRVGVVLDVDPGAPLQVVLDAAEAAERGGARRLAFCGLPDSPVSPPAAPSAWTLDIPGGPPPRPWPPFTPRGRVSGGLGGFDVAHYFGTEEDPPPR